MISLARREGEKPYLKREGLPLNPGELVNLVDYGVVKLPATCETQTYNGHTIVAWAVYVPEGWIAITEILKEI